LILREKFAFENRQGETAGGFAGDFPPTFIATAKSPRRFSAGDFAGENSRFISTAPG
jgi:hypothetical protein